MIEVRRTDEFIEWLRSLKDRAAARRIAIRVARIEAGLLGDVKRLEGIAEVRIDYGPGYRLYFVQKGEAVVLLCGGDKGSQSRDIRRARRLAKELE
jgi:putative addiction module killer protein